MTPMLPATANRVELNTAPEVNGRIRRQIEEGVVHYAAHPREIDGRLNELDEEWDIERVLEANAASLALTGIFLGAFVDRRFLILPAAVAAFLLQHALQGWCPPVPFFRKRGVRTAAEIDRERRALKALRGDFAALDETRAVAGWGAYRMPRARERAHLALDAARA
jgi:Protein of unknown function (DUF2892)